MNLPVADFRPFKDLRKKAIKNIFGRGRTFSRGLKFAAEGFLTDMTIKIGDGDAVVKTSCFASQTKEKKHKVFLAIDTSKDQFQVVENRCSCAAGNGLCSHQCAVYHLLCAGGAFVRSLEIERDLPNLS